MKAKTIYWIIGILLLLWIANGIFFMSMFGSGGQNQQYLTPNNK